MYLMLLLQLIGFTGFFTTYGGHHNRVTGGFTTTIDKFPFIVSLVVFNDKSNEWNIVCGGTIIHPYTVLTAATCIDKMMKVELGSLQVRSNTETWGCVCQRTRVHTVAGFMKHERFSTHVWKKNKLYPNDIALLTVYEKFAGLYERVIDYDHSTAFWKTFEPNHVSNNIEAVGWGDSLGNLTSAYQLRRVGVNVYKYSACMDLYHSPAIVDRRLYCGLTYSPEVKGPCMYDEGGPLLGKYNGEWVLIGIISTATGCHKHKPHHRHPTIYVNVSMYVEWIDKNMVDGDPNRW